MGNIFNNNHLNIKFRINNEKYYDFCLFNDKYDSKLNNSFNNCLISYIDTRDPNCVWFEKLFSKSEYFWEDSTTNKITLNNIGFTGVDNGIIQFEKDRISNIDFFKLFTNSKLTISENEKRLILRKITGNTQAYQYPSYFIIDDGENVLKLNGGFYQGFFKTSDCKYQVLPSSFDNGITIQIDLKKVDFEKESEKTLNDYHPNNKGIFFYIGTRAENKWWTIYDGKPNDYISYSNKNSFLNNDEKYISDNYFSDNSHIINEEYIKESKEEKEEYSNDYFSDEYIGDYCDKNYFSDSYITDDYMSNICNCNLYVKDEYLSNEIKLPKYEEIKTNDGYNLKTPNIFEIKTDNKFTFFNRTCTGFTTENWNDKYEIILTGVTENNSNNFFTLFNRTCSGYTTEDIPDKYLYDTTYDVAEDLYNNALAFIIKDDGSIGYRYLTNDCVEDKKTLSIIEEYSVSNVIENDIWNSVSIKIKTSKHSKYMIILIYVNGKLKLKSKKLNKLNLRALNDLDSKQESVPFNISLGGGTQGLCDMIGLNYMELPKYVFPLEKYFAGTFIGEIKSLKIHNCSISYNEITNNNLNY